MVKPQRPVRVGFVVHVMQVAGAEVLVAETIRQLGELIKPTVICLDSIGMIGEKLRASGVEVMCLGRRPGRDWRVSWRLAKIVREHQIHVLHAHQYTPFFYSALAKLLSGGRCRLVLTEHGRHYPDIVKPLRRAMNRLVLDHCADAVNACCRFSARGLNHVDGFSGSRIEIIENGIDLSKYWVSLDKQKAKADLGLRSDRLFIACIARFHPVKDHDTLLRAFAIVAAKHEQVELLLAGDGPRKADLERLAGELGVHNRVHFLGIRSDVPQLLSAVDIFALTSVSEAASLTLLEAMASGLPVVVTEVGGNPEIVCDGVEGYLAPRGDFAALANRMDCLLENATLRSRMGQAGRQRVEDHYRLGDTIHSYYRLYQRLLARDAR